MLTRTPLIDIVMGNDLDLSVFSLHQLKLHTIVLIFINLNKFTVHMNKKSNIEEFHSRNSKIVSFLCNIIKTIHITFLWTNSMIHALINVFILLCKAFLIKVSKYGRYHETFRDGIRNQIPFIYISLSLCHFHVFWIKQIINCYIKGWIIVKTKFSKQINPQYIITDLDCLRKYHCLTVNHMRIV